MVLQQYTNFEKADFVLVNSFEELELHEKELWSKVCPVLTIGPTIPSIYLDQRIKSDTDYDLNLFEPIDASFCTKWLDTRPQGSVVYVALGSMAQLNNVQMEELALALANFSFLWVVRSSEEAKLPSGFLESVNKEKNMVLKWSPQLQVLSNKTIGCFLTHCGWNSTMEALTTFGVPMTHSPLVSGLSSQLINVKKAAAMDSNSLINETAEIANGITKVKEIITDLKEENGVERFLESMNSFLNKAEKEITEIQSHGDNVMKMVKEVTEYFHGNSESHLFRIFAVVRDFLTILDQVCKEVGRVNERTVYGSVPRHSPSNQTTMPLFPVVNNNNSRLSLDDDNGSF